MTGAGVHPPDPGVRYSYLEGSPRASSAVPGPVDEADIAAAAGLCSRAVPCRKRPRAAYPGEERPGVPHCSTVRNAVVAPVAGRGIPLECCWAGRRSHRRQGSPRSRPRDHPFACRNARSPQDRGEEDGRPGVRRREACCEEGGLLCCCTSCAVAAVGPWADTVAGIADYPGVRLERPRGRPQPPPGVDPVPVAWVPLSRSPFWDRFRAVVAGQLPETWTSTRSNLWATVTASSPASFSVDRSSHCRGYYFPLASMPAKQLKKKR